jgi:Bacterial aa3 type cytochrome c oxidase subunit IV
MSEHSSNAHPPAQDMAAHEATYDGFIKFSVAGSIICIYVLVALVTFRFMNNPANVIVGFGGLILGIITSIIALRLGGKWMVAVVPLILFTLFVAANVQMS